MTQRTFTAAEIEAHAWMAQRNDHWCDEVVRLRVAAMLRQAAAVVTSNAVLRRESATKDAELAQWRQQYFLLKAAREGQMEQTDQERLIHERDAAVADADTKRMYAEDVSRSLAEAQREIERLTGHDLDCRCDVLSGSHVDWEHHTLCLLRRECKDEKDRHAKTSGELLMAQRETARLLAVNGESNAVCSCGCELVDHEERGEEGWSCDNESHECVPTSMAVAQMLRQHESALAAVTRERETAQAQVQALREAIRLWSEGVDDEGGEESYFHSMLRDGACQQCYPDRAVSNPAFVCDFHMLRAIAIGPEPPREKA